MAQHMKPRDMTWRELFNTVKQYAEMDGDGVWDLPVATWFGDSAHTFCGVHAEYLLYPSYREAPISDENWLMLDINATNMED